MITILAVGREAEDLAAYGASHPSVEVVASEGAEDALERLARNRRIDAVLILESSEAAELSRLVREEDPGAPPLFAVSEEGEMPGVRALGAGSPEELLADVLRAIGSD